MNVRYLSNHELDISLKRLVVSERKILNLILEHILEVENRKMYLEKAYATCYEYLTKELGYSGSAAMRRLSAARLLRELPEVAEQINKGNINLSQITELTRAIKEKEKTGDQVSTLMKQELVTAIAGKSTAESQKEIAKALYIELKPPEKTLLQKDDSVHLQITLSKQQFENLMKCRDLAAHVLLTESKDTSVAAVISYLSDCYLGKIGKASSSDSSTMTRSKTIPVTTKVGISEQSEEELTASTFCSQARTQAQARPQAQRSETVQPSTLKTLTPKTRRTVLTRDQHCQYQDPKSGRICGSKFNLTVDHIQPQWAAGDHSLHNLQALCQGHNNQKYRNESNLKLF